MNAVEYFKAYGLSEAKRILRDARGCASVRLYDKYNFSTDDLKQIVDAYEFVKRFGLDEAKKFAGWYGGDTAFKFLKVKEKSISVHSGDQPYDFHINNLKQIVDAFELVDRFGGYDSVLNMINNPTCFGDSNFEIEIKLNESINLVEQCND